MKELDLLLEKYWIIKEDDKEVYYNLRDSISDIRPFLTEKLGYQIIITPDLIKLEKLPGKTESWMGIESFDDKMEYIFLCQLLMFLEDKGKEEQFLLSEITEYILGTFTGDEKVDWTLYRHRKYLIKVLRFALDMNMIKANDGDEKNFASVDDVEVLYENTGTSKYFMRNFSGNVMTYGNLQDFENDEWIDIDRDRGRIRRNRVYRRVIMSPAVYNEGVEDPDYIYIKNYRNMIQSDIEKYFESEFHVHKGGAFLILNSDKNYRRTFPEHRAISDISLQMNEIIIQKIKEGSFRIEDNDTIIVSMQSFNKIVSEVKQMNIEGWSKEYREMKFDKLSCEIINYMKDFNMVEINREMNQVKILPLVGKIVGKYPNDFNNTIEEGDIE